MSFNTDGSFTDMDIKEKHKRIKENTLYGIFTFFNESGIVINKNNPTYSK